MCSPFESAIRVPAAHSSQNGEKFSGHESSNDHPPPSQPKHHGQSHWFGFDLHRISQSFVRTNATWSSVAFCPGLSP